MFYHKNRKQSRTSGSWCQGKMKKYSAKRKSPSTIKMLLLPALIYRLGTTPNKILDDNFVELPNWKIHNRGKTSKIISLTLNKLNSGQTYPALCPSTKSQQSSMPGAVRSTHRDKPTQNNDLLPQESKRYNGAQKFYFTNDAGATKHPDGGVRKNESRHSFRFSTRN